MFDPLNHRQQGMANATDKNKFKAKSNSWNWMFHGGKNPKRAGNMGV